MACSQPGFRLCATCRQWMAPAAPRRVLPNLAVRPALLHAGSARELVHRLKYSGVNGPARVLAEYMVSELPGDATGLIPVPRNWARRARFGVDPAWELARELAGLCGLPTLSCLAAPLWAPPHAGMARSRRRPSSFRVLRIPPDGAVLVDDVITTGATLASAAGSLGVSRAVTATSAGI